MDRGHLVLIHQFEKADRVEARLIDGRPSEDEVHQIEEGGCGVVERAADEMHLVRAHLEEADGLHHVFDDLGPGGEVGAAGRALGLSRGPGGVDHGAARGLASRQVFEIHLGWVVEEVLVVSGSVRRSTEDDEAVAVHCLVVVLEGEDAVGELVPEEAGSSSRSRRR